jgi:hypothetical protein
MVCFAGDGKYLADPEIGPVSNSDMSGLDGCRHWTNSGSPSKRSWQIGLQTQKIVMLWQ